MLPVRHGRKADRDQFKWIPLAKTRTGSEHVEMCQNNYYHQKTLCGCFINIKLRTSTTIFYIFFFGSTFVVCLLFCFSVQV